MADGGRIAASGPSEFVRVLRQRSWFDSGCTDGEYMVNFSGRYRELHGVKMCIRDRDKSIDASVILGNLIILSKILNCFT